MNERITMWITGKMEEIASNLCWTWNIELADKLRGDGIPAQYTRGPKLRTVSSKISSICHRCSGSLNVEGYSVDACVENGTKCGQAAADAFCQYLGFDKNAPGLYSTVVAAAPALSMTGTLWCLLISVCGACRAAQTGRGKSIREVLLTA